MAIVLLPYMYIPDPARGRPVFNGKIYIGVADTDPRIPENQKEALLIQEDGTSVPAEYPILTNAGGVPTHNGSSVAIEVVGEYSIAIDDRSDQQVYYFPVAGDEVELLASDLRSIMFDLGFTYDQIGTLLVTDAVDTNLDEAEYILNTTTGEVWRLPSNVPDSSVVVSLTGNVLVTNNGQFNLIKKQDDITQEASPRNNDWNGFLDPSHTVPIEIEDTSSGARSFDANAEIAPNIYVTTTDNVTFSDTGWSWVAPQSIYKLYAYTVEQLALIDESTVPVYIVDETGKRHFVNDGTTGVNVTKPDTTTLKVELTSDAFATLGINKVWDFFSTDGVGFVPRLGPSESERAVKYLSEDSFVTLVNKLDDAGPRDKPVVSSEIPASIGANTRLVVTNPFGNNTPVNVTAEIFVNDLWSAVDNSFNNGITSLVPQGMGGYYVQGVGVVVQTAQTSIVAESSKTLGGHDQTGGVTSAPIRIRVKRK